jgi:RNA polymerase sigma factor (sigma-70 family)
MDVALGEPQGEPPNASALGTAKRGAAALQVSQVAAILDGCRRRELRIARGFRECRGLTREQLEDLYGETTVALLERPYQDEKHVRDALRLGIKRRALNLHSVELRRREILAENAPGIHVLEAARSEEESPERLVLAHEDSLLIAEFLAELTPEEQKVFRLMSDGLHYNRIAKELEKPGPVARRLVDSCERKRERFQTLHDRGRLCGYRATTIKALLDGQATSEELVALAAAHLQACARCRADHNMNARRLRLAFDKRAAALLPPVAIGRLGWLTRVSVHARALTQRGPHWLTVARGGARERAATLLAGGGASAKLAAGIVTAAVVAGATVTATHALGHHEQHAPRRHAAPSTLVRASRPANYAQPARPAATAAASHVYRAPVVQRRRSHGHVVATAHLAAKKAAGNAREPGGFAYLGVPTHTTTTPPPPPPPAVAQSGGPFSP